jgi:IclR family acetate operon transcriptional repressor
MLKTAADGNGGDGAVDGRYRVPAAARVLSLLEFLADAHEPIGVSEAARRTGIPKSSCFALMTTLEQAGYVRRNERDEWTLTLRIFHLGTSAARNMDISIVAQPILERLCESTGLTAHLGMFDGSSMIYALKAEPPSGIVRFDTYPGKPASLHLTAIGRAAASEMPKAELESLLDGYEFTGGVNPRIRSRSGYLAELRRVRERGYAIEAEEETSGVMCVAAPVRAPSPAAVGIAALAVQVQEKTVETIGAAVAGSAKELSLRLGEGDTER